MAKRLKRRASERPSLYAVLQPDGVVDIHYYGTFSKESIDGWSILSKEIVRGAAHHCDLTLSQFWARTSTPVIGRPRRVNI